jgi:hypothetical protein
VEEPVHRDGSGSGGKKGGKGNGRGRGGARKGRKRGAKKGSRTRGDPTATDEFLQEPGVTKDIDMNKK